MASAASPEGANRPGTEPGQPRHIAVDRQGIPLALVATGASRDDAKDLADRAWRNTTGAGQTRTATAASGQGTCREGVRLRALPGVVETARRYGTHCSPWYRKQRKARSPSPDCRTHACMACRLRQTARPLRTGSRYSYRLAHPCLCSYLLAIRRAVC